MPRHTTGSLASELQATLVGPADLPLERIDTIETIDDRAITFIRSAAFGARWASCKAGAALVTAGIDVTGHDASRRALLFVKDADLALIRCLELFAAPATPVTPGIHPTAIIDPAAVIDPTASIGAWSIIGPGAHIGRHVVIGPNVLIGQKAKIGINAILHHRVYIGDHCELGERCLLWPGVVIGADGFGYRPSPDGRGFMKIPHIGNVVVGNDVEIGANSCIDRGKLGSTTVGDGTKIDNLVQIAHNCKIGRHCIIAGHSGIAGSTTVGDGCIIGGKVGITDNLAIGAGVRIGANSGVSGHVPAGETIFGYPAARVNEMRRVVAAWHKLPDLLERVRELERRTGVRASNSATGNSPRPAEADPARPAKNDA